MQPIRLEASSGNVQTGILGIVEVDEVTPVHRRGSAIHDYNPMHTFMFDSNGRPLFANKAAMKGCLSDAEGSGAIADACRLLSNIVCICEHGLSLSLLAIAHLAMTSYLPILLL